MFTFFSHFLYYGPNYTASIGIKEILYILKMFCISLLVNEFIYFSIYFNFSKKKTVFIDEEQLQLKHQRILVDRK